MSVSPHICRTTQCVWWHTYGACCHGACLLADVSNTHARCALPADFFYSMLNLRLPVALAMMAAAYLFSFLLWALIWHGVYWCAALAPAG